MEKFWQAKTAINLQIANRMPIVFTRVFVGFFKETGQRYPVVSAISAEAINRCERKIRFYIAR